MFFEAPSEISYPTFAGASPQIPYSSFRIRTCRSACKQSILSTFRIDTYAKREGGCYGYSGASCATVFVHEHAQTTSFRHAPPSRYERADRVRLHFSVALLHRSAHPRNRKGKNLSPHVESRRNDDAALRGRERRQENHRRRGNLFHDGNRRRTCFGSAG